MQSERDSHFRSPLISLGSVNINNKWMSVTNHYRGSSKTQCPWCSVTIMFIFALWKFPLCVLHILRKSFIMYDNSTVCVLAYLFPFICLLFIHLENWSCLACLWCHLVAIPIRIIDKAGNATKIIRVNSFHMSEFLEVVIVG